MIPGRKLIKPPDTLPPGQRYLSNGETGCCSYSTGVRLTFLLAFKLFVFSFLVLCGAGEGGGLPASHCSSACEFDLVGPGFSKGRLSGLGLGGVARFPFFSFFFFF